MRGELEFVADEAAASLLKDFADQRVGGVVAVHVDDLIEIEFFACPAEEVHKLQTVFDVLEETPDLRFVEQGAFCNLPDHAEFKEGEPADIDSIAGLVED